MRRRRLILGLAGAVVLGGIALGPFIEGGRRMETFCAGLSPGMEADAVVERIVAAGLRRSGSGTVWFIQDGASFGRFVCRIEWRDGRLASRAYLEND